MFHINNEKIKAELFKGSFGLEMEGLRITQDGHMSHKPHPFNGNSRIERDFCENQTEINTEVARSAEEAYELLYNYVKEIRATLNNMEEPELLWPFSNPPYLLNEEDIPIAQFEGERIQKTTYREYLSERYGRYIMTYSGIHVNYSFSEELLKLDYEESGYEDFGKYKNEVYLKLAKAAEAYGWIVTALTAASPIADLSFFEKGKVGKTVENGMASFRCSEIGYWNYFTPLLKYGSLEEYTKSIEHYVELGFIVSPSELYYPVRLKPKGENSLELLKEKGINHIELRMIDLNPLDKAGVDIRDIKFIELFMLWLVLTEKEGFTSDCQIIAIQNFKNAAHYDLSLVKVTLPGNRSMPGDKAALYIMEEMQKTFAEISDEAYEILEYEKKKVLYEEMRYAYRIKQDFGQDYVNKGIELAKMRLKEQ